MSAPTKLAQKIATKDEKIQQLLNEKRQLQQKYNAAERKARTNRLCRRHGLLEKAMPGIITITDGQFEEFIKRGINTSYGKKILAEIVAKAGATPAPITAEPPLTIHASGGTCPPEAEPWGA
jgi:hypothetical protein